MFGTHPWTIVDPIQLIELADPLSKECQTTPIYKHIHAHKKQIKAAILTFINDTERNHLRPQSTTKQYETDDAGNYHYHHCFTLLVRYSQVYIYTLACIYLTAVVKYICAYLYDIIHEGKVPFN